MKGIYLLITAAAAILSAARAESQTGHRNTYPANDKNIVWVGRVAAGEDGSISGDWTGIYARIRFSGDYLSATVSDSKKNYYNLWVDKPSWQEPDKIITTSGKDTTITLLSNEELTSLFGKKLAKRPHQVLLQKRTEGEQGRTTFHSFSTGGTLLPADALRPRVIEFVGDSYTCGYGSENSTKNDPFLPETENCNKSYCNIVARYFDAECVLVAHSGFGIARNYNDNVKGWYMSERYGQLYDMDRESRWDSVVSPVRPDITVIYLCTNDFSTDRQPSKSMFKTNYISLLHKIKDAYGKNHPVLCVAGKNDFLMAEYIFETVGSCGMENVSYAILCPEVHDAENDLGASYHPNYNGHIKKAYSLIPYISTMTGWEIDPEKAIR